MLPGRELNSMSVTVGPACATWAKQATNTVATNARNRFAVLALPFITAFFPNVSVILNMAYIS
ncbi:hypothetical protein GCM10027297_26700 [Parahaliea aestuarii]